MKQRIHAEGFKEFKLDKLENMLFKSKKEITSEQFKRFSLDEQCEKDLKKNKTFIINDPEPLRQGKRTEKGIYSPLFGQDALSKDNHSIYSCNCQNPALLGAMHIGKMCPLCNTEVSAMSSDLSKMAYIDIAPYHVLTETGIIAFKRHHKINVMGIVIKTLPKVTLKGQLERDAKDVTLLDLYDNYDELYKDKMQLPRKHIFTSKIPVFSAKLRPLIMNGSTVIHFEVNKHYLALVNLENDLRDAIRTNRVNETRKNEIQILRILNKMQELYFLVETEIDELMKGKTGKFRKDMAAARINYVSRLVIGLDDELRPYEIRLPYSAFMIMYEEEVVRQIKIMKECSMKEAQSMFFMGMNKITKTCKRAIKQLIEHPDGFWDFINRNPTIALGSALVCKISSVTFDINDKIMYLPPDILPLMNADFDGDQLTCVALKYQELVNAYRPFFQPTYMMLNRATGFFNEALGLKKDHAAIIYTLSAISRKINAYLKGGENNMKIREDLRRYGFDMKLNAGLSEDEVTDYIEEYTLTHPMLVDRNF